MDVELKGISKSFGEKRVLADVSALFPCGEISCIMAPSGVGKTTLLRILMGLEQPDSGAIIGLEHQKISVVFQEDRLLSHMNPVDNIRLVAPHLKESEVVLELEKVGLLDCITQPIAELSGGMKRRVALLRGLLAEYDILLLDEPFRGLDAQRKEEVLVYLKAKTKDKTVLLVTHDMEEAELLEVNTFLYLQ
ncbi:ATP-binding cassette domain-containing protein [Chakrabartyella piscis]|uniref:ATP-binding cassette domain-containing protein n=1 Tax=Chakrabartyella piscis TaxID=2918914 RepID=UPI0029588EC1|nr:ATP-binding cassette domain-containing protein [Chakrabartyella piscis]